MAFPTIIIGILLIALGAGGYGYALSNETPENKASMTALIPAYFGVALLVCGVLAFKQSRRKVVMHLAVLIGVLGFAGALMRPISKSMKGESVDWTSVPVMSQLTMAGLCLIFVIMCVNSFIQARRAR